MSMLFAEELMMSLLTIAKDTQAPKTLTRQAFSYLYLITKVFIQFKKYHIVTSTAALPFNFQNCYWFYVHFFKWSQSTEKLKS